MLPVPVLFPPGHEPLFLLVQHGRKGKTTKGCSPCNWVLNYLPWLSLICTKLKLAPLLARYLYTHHRMDLPGLGTFRIDPQTNNSEDSTTLEGVSFENDPGIKHSPELVQFISAEAGKMKALAAADLASHLELAHQFLNIGKPFMFDGIGSLVKQRNGEYSFAAGPVLPELVQKKENPQSTGLSDDPDADYKKIFYGKRVKATGTPALTFLLAAFGIAVAVWGGYSIYKKNQRNNVGPETEVALAEPNVENEVIFTSTAAAPADTVQEVKINQAPSEQDRKFILETANAKRAFARYNKLKSFQWKVEMETTDSVLYKLYVMVPTNLTDTTRILDSLTRMNGKRVHME